MTKFAVVVASTEDELPAWVSDPVREEANEMFDEYDGERSLLLINFDGEIEMVWDGGEPEDNTFARDHEWIPGAIRRAYELGLKHGQDARA